MMVESHNMKIRKHISANETNTAKNEINNSWSIEMQHPRKDTSAPGRLNMVNQARYI